MPAMTYASALARLAAGDELTGAELLALPEYTNEDQLAAAVTTYSIDLVPGVLVAAASLAKRSGLEGPRDDSMLTVAMINHELTTNYWPAWEPLPSPARVALQAIGVAADFTVAMERRRVACPS